MLICESCLLLTARAEAAEADAKELRELFDAFTEGQAAAIGKQPRESNPYPPGDSFAINPRWRQWDDGYDCNINRELKIQLVAAEATLATLREEFQRHKDQSFKLFTDAVDRADKSEATVSHLRDAANVALSFLRHMTEDAKGMAGATAERALLAATEGKDG